MGREKEEISITVVVYVSNHNSEEDVLDRQAVARLRRKIDPLRAQIAAWIAEDPRLRDIGWIE